MSRGSTRPCPAPQTRLSGLLQSDGGTRTHDLLLYRKQERVAVPACNLAAVRARELRVDGLASIQTFNLDHGWAAVNLGADGVARSGRKGIGQGEELLAGLLGRWMRSTCEIAVEPPFPKRSSVVALRPHLDMEDGLDPR
jgi:hypothetical protein